MGIGISSDLTSLPVMGSDAKNSRKFRRTLLLSDWHGVEAK